MIEKIIVKPDMICSTTADSSSAAGILGKPDAPEYSLVSRVLM
jgi:hypothetical protein